MRAASLHPRLWLAGALLALTWADGCDLNPQPLPPGGNEGTTNMSSGSSGSSGSGSGSGGLVGPSSGSSGGPSGGVADAGLNSNAGGDAATIEGGFSADAAPDGAVADAATEASTDASTDASPDATGSLGSGALCDTSHDECGPGLRCCYSGGVPLDGGPKLSTCMIDTCTPFPP